MKALLLAAAMLAATSLGCTGGDDTTTPIDAPQGDGAVGPDGGGGPDAPAACVLPSTSITCTDNTPCTSVCGNAYCYNFMQVGMRCTQPCTPGSTTECPSGWSCNNMGRCRPPA